MWLGGSGSRTRHPRTLTGWQIRSRLQYVCSVEAVEDPLGPATRRACGYHPLPHALVTTHWTLPPSWVDSPVAASYADLVCRPPRRYRDTLPSGS